MNKLRDFMFENVYHSKKVKKDEELDKIKHMIFSPLRLLWANPDKLPDEWKRRIPEYGVQEVERPYCRND